MRQISSWGGKRKSWWIGLWLFLFVAGCPAPATQHHRIRSRKAKHNTPEVAIVKSKNSPVYREVVTGFSITSRAAVVEYNMADSVGRGKRIIARLKKTRPAMILTIGPLATKMVQHAIRQIPLLFCLVPNYPIHLDPGAMQHVLGITLTRSIRYQFLTIKKLAPQTKTIGVIYNPSHSRQRILKAKKIIRTLGMRLVAARVDTAEDVAQAIRTFEGNIDALWQVADPSIKASFRRLLRFTFKSKIPFFALSEKLVQSGALVSVALDYAEIGHQAARMSNRLLFQKARLQDLGIQHPQRLQISLNLTTAGRIGVECDIALEVLKFAARKGFRLRVFQ